MGESTKIAWCHHTFNPWWGCARVSPGCERCYAETFSKRVGLQLWGVQAPRRFFGDKHWAEPLKWNEKARAAGERRRVFCASMADVFEDRPELVEHRARLWRLIGETPSLDWLLLTKRPENAERIARQAALLAWDGGGPDAPTWLPNIWIGTTVEDQDRAGKRLLWLLEIPARVRFVSCEPLLEEIDLENVELDFLKRDPHPYDPIVRLDALRGHMKGPDELLDARVDWVIVGGESGPKARPFDVRWAEGVIRQCRDAGVACFVKQLGAHPVDVSREMGPGSYPKTMPGGDPWPPARVRLKHRKGEDPSEWPAHLRVQEFPCPEGEA